MAQQASFDGVFHLVTTGGKISRDVKGSEKALGEFLKKAAETWIEAHTNGRVTGQAAIEVAYHYGWGKPTVVAAIKRLRKIA